MAGPRRGGRWPPPAASAALAGAVALLGAASACLLQGAGLRGGGDDAGPPEDASADAGDADADLDPDADRDVDGGDADADRDAEVDRDVEADADPVPEGWWDAAWTRRRRVDFDGSALGEALVGFPALVALDPGRIDYEAVSDGGRDLRFLDQDGATPLPYEVEAWQQRGTSVLWVRVPRIEAGSRDGHVWMYYGNDAAPAGASPGGVWEPSFEAVWHLGEGLRDSTLAGHDGTDVGSSAAAGVVGGGRAFDGSGSYVDTGYSEHLTVWTVSAWARGASVPDGDLDGPLMEEESFQLGWDHFDPEFRGAASLRVGGTWYAATFGPLEAGPWYLLAATYDGETLVAYVNGLETGRNEAPSGPADDSPHGAKIGRHAFRTDYPPFFHGDVDEVRIAEVPRSPSWMAADHLSMTDRLATFGPEERLPDP